MVGRNIIDSQFSNLRIFGWLLLFTVVHFSCATTKKIKDGRTAFQQKQYAVAVDFLLNEVAQKEGTDEYPELAYLLGESYKNLNDSESSLKWYIEAAKNNYGPEAYWEMSYALKKNERYEDAILSFRRLAQMTDRKREIAQEIEKCRQARKWLQVRNNEKYTVEALMLNSTESDYAPALYNGRNLVFTSDRIQESEDVYAWTGNSFSDLYISDIDVYNPVPFDDKINTPFNEGTATFSGDGKQMFFTRCHSEVGDSYCRIYMSRYENGIWSEPVEPMRFEPRVNYGDPVLIENDSVLIFVSNDPKGIGGHDLYYSVLLEDGQWDVPELMPPYLNSIGQERFPTWDQKNVTLYYSSDHFAGLGGLDIFKTTLREDGSWTRPENLLAPINSSEDDYGLIFVEEAFLADHLKSKAFFTSTRGVFGNDDIYTLYEEYPEGEIPVKETEEVIVEAEEEPELPRTYFLRVEVFEKLYAIQDNPNSFVVGSRKMPRASLKIQSEVIDEIFETDANGVLVIPIDSSYSFSLLAGKEGYLNKQESLVISEEDRLDKPDGHVFEKKIVIDRVFEGIEIVIDNIYYDLNKSDIREDAKPALNNIIELMKDNPVVRIELGSHTDCRADDDYNLDLSNRRATSAMEYIIAEGNIDAQRISSIGYGETKLEIACICEECTEEEHQINRRTTFKILR